VQIGLELPDLGRDNPARVAIRLRMSKSARDPRPARRPAAAEDAYVYGSRNVVLRSSLSAKAGRSLRSAARHVVVEVVAILAQCEGRAQRVGCHYSAKLAAWALFGACPATAIRR